jgi:hypothetical protein
VIVGVGVEPTNTLEEAGPVVELPMVVVTLLM